MSPYWPSDISKSKNAGKQGTKRHKSNHCITKSALVCPHAFHSTAHQTRKLFFHSVADLGGAVGGNCPPPSWWKLGLAPHFRQEGRPLSSPKCTLFFAFHSGCGKHENQGVIQLKNQRICPKERPKNFCAPSGCLLFAIFLAPTLQIAPLQLRAGSAPAFTRPVWCM